MTSGSGSPGDQIAASALNCAMSPGGTITMALPPSSRQTTSTAPKSTPVLPHPGSDSSRLASLLVTKSIACSWSRRSSGSGEVAIGAEGVGDVMRDCCTDR
ncbi:hypothetical protein GCM10027270_35470 [Nocardioides ginkgobilobae]